MSGDAVPFCLVLCRERGNGLWGLLLGILQGSIPPFLQAPADFVQS